MPKKFEFVKDLTSDVMFRAYGKNQKELFENAALALFTVICQVKKVKPIEHVEVIVEGKVEKDLLYNWLQALIAEVDVRQMFFSRFEVVDISAKKVSAILYGEEMTKEKGETVVKAVTNYKFMLEKVKSGYVAQVSLDI